MRGPTCWTVGAAEEDRHRTKRCAVEAHAGGKASLRLGAVDDDCAHRVVLTPCCLDDGAAHRTSKNLAMTHVKVAGTKLTVFREVEVNGNGRR